LAFTASNVAGNFVAVAVRAFVANQTITVSDTRGNLYRQAVKVNNSTDDTLAIFYAENITAGANTVKVSVSTMASLRIAIFEYAGVATSNSLDVTSSSALSSAAPNSGSATTTVGGGLVIGAFATQSY